MDASDSQAGATDYILLARFHSDIKDRAVITISGLDRAATVSDGDYLTSSVNLPQLTP